MSSTDLCPFSFYKLLCMFFSEPPPLLLLLLLFDSPAMEDYSFAGLREMLVRPSTQEQSTFGSIFSSSSSTLSVQRQAWAKELETSHVTDMFGEFYFREGQVSSSLFSLSPSPPLPSPSETETKQLNGQEKKEETTRALGNGGSVSAQRL